MTIDSTNEDPNATGDVRAHRRWRREQIHLRAQANVPANVTEIDGGTNDDSKHGWKKSFYNHTFVLGYTYESPSVVLPEKPHSAVYSNHYPLIMISHQLTFFVRRSLWL